MDARVTQLEHDVAQLRSELRSATTGSQAARVLASGADRDVSQVRAHLQVQTSLLTALRDTQREHGEALREHSQKFDALDARMGSLETEMREGFSTVHVGMAQITALLTTIARDDER